jgi:transcriptional regulator with XRE-family HTH domain
MSFLRELSGMGTRPYPIDRERRRRVLRELVERDMTISDLAKALNLCLPHISNIISGRRLSARTEQRVAEFLGKPADDLFPVRTPEEIGKMRRAEEAAKGKPRRDAA